MPVIIVLLELRCSSIYFAGDVIKDQAEADEDSSVKERAAMGVGKGLSTV